MLTRPRRARTLAAVLTALLAAPAAVFGSAAAAQADAVRQQELWVLNAMNVAGAWQHTRGSGVTVALIDSGVNGQVSDLAGSVVTGRDFSGVNTPPTNPNWGVHGTWMASLIAGHGHAAGQSSGIMGVAPAARILSIRAVTDQGDPGYRRYQHEPASRVQTHLAGAIRYATSKRVSVISMSLGYQGASRPVRAAISAALAKGIVVVASSGNSGGAATGHPGNAPYSFPADYPGVLGVGAVRQSGLPAGFSSDNLSVQVAAPGVRVPAQGRDGQYWLVSGTSPACALTAGVAALIKSAYPSLAPALVVQAITSTTSNKPRGGYDQEVGFGTVDATAALKMAGRLARDRGTGRGLVAAAQFGGGPGAIPAVPVAPRTKQQLVVDTLIALAFLVMVLVLAFRLIATRRPARAGPAAAGPVAAGAAAAVVAGGWGPGAGPAGRGGGPGGTGRWADAPPSGGLAGTAEPGPGGPGASGPGPGLPGGPGAAGRGAPGGSDGWPDAGGAGYGRSAGYWVSGGYKPPAQLRPDLAYGQQPGFLPPELPGAPADQAGPAGYGVISDCPRPAAPRQAAGPAMPGNHPGPVSPGRPAVPGPPGSRHPAPPRPVPPGSAWPGLAMGNGSRPGHGAPPVPGTPGEPSAAGRNPTGSRPPAGSRPPGGSQLPANDQPPVRLAPGMPGGPGGTASPGAVGTPAGRPVGAGTGPAPGCPQPDNPRASEPGRWPSADDDTWPSPSAW